MKKINRIGYGGKILAAALLFLLAIPAVLHIVLWYWESQALLWCARASAAIGGLILIFLLVLLAVELRQDKNRNRMYCQKKNQKLSLGNGQYECQSCGNRMLKEDDRCCGICGVRFNKP